MSKFYHFFINSETIIIRSQTLVKITSNWQNFARNIQILKNIEQIVSQIWSYLCGKQSEMIVFESLSTPFEESVVL